MSLCIRLNGEQKRLTAPVRLAQLQELIDTTPRDGIAVAVNGHVVPRAQWNDKEVRDGDDIEIVRAVQGG
jgi:sulfur carrier protein